MEPFRISCETCSAQLKVRDERAIGEIHACPKCGSMVHILPPAGWQAASAEVAGAAVESPAEQVAAEATPAEMHFLQGSAPPAPAGLTHAPIVAWGLGGAVLLVLGLGVGIWAGDERSGGGVASVAGVADTAADNEEPASPPRYEVERPIEPTEELSAALRAEAEVESVAKTQAEPAPAPPGVPDLPPLDVDAASVAVAPAAEEVAALKATVAKDESPKDAAPPVLKFDPLDFDPTRLSLASGAAAPSIPSNGSIADDPAAEIELPAEPPTDDSAEDLLLPPQAHDESLQVRLGPMPSDAPRTKTASEQLALEVDSLELADIPLERFIEVVSDLAGTAITLDPVALELAGVSPHTAISADAKGVTLEKLLRDALSKQRLDWKEHEGQARVELRSGGRRRTVEYDVRDLSAGDDGEPVADLIEQFVAPANWQSAGGKGSIEVNGTTLRIEQATAVHHEILIFCERLRLARGLPPRSRYPAERLSIEPPYAKVAARLQQTATFTFLPWTRLADVVRYWEEPTGLTILVDWSALAEVELEPASPLACAAIERSWNEALGGILEPLGLTWWAVDANTLQITSVEALDEVRRLEFYPLPPGFRDQFASSEAMVESLQEELPELAADNGSKARPTRIGLDPPSGRLIVLGSPGVHRHLFGRLHGNTR